MKFRSLLMLLSFAIASSCSTDENSENRAKYTGATSTQNADGITKFTSNGEVSKARTQFLTYAYLYCLGRKPDQPGLDYWKEQLDNKVATPKQIEESICNSTEGQMASFYFQILARDPDQDGMNYWMTEIKEGRLTIRQVGQSISVSDEASGLSTMKRRPRFEGIMNGRRSRLDSSIKEIVALEAQVGGESNSVPAPLPETSPAAENPTTDTSTPEGQSTVQNVDVAMQAPAGVSKDSPLTTLASATPSEASISDARVAYLTSVYAYCLGRQPDQAGLDFWKAQLDANVLEPQGVKNAVCDSLEGQVASFYFRFLYRNPDQAGIDFWMAEINNGNLTITGVEQSIRDSSEAAAPATALRRTAFVNERAQLAFNLLTEEVAIITSITEVAVETAYYLCLGRASDPAGKAFWVNEIREGAIAATALEASICNSDEGKIADFYQQILNRDPDKAGMDFWLAELANGFSLDEIDRYFRDSDEAKSGLPSKRANLFDEIQSERRALLGRLVSLL